MDILNTKLFGNTISEWTVAIAAAGIFYLVLFLLKGFLKKRSDRINHALGRANFLLIIGPMLDRTLRVTPFLLAIYIGSLFLELPPKVSSLINKVALVALFTQLILWANTFIDLYSRQYREVKLKNDLTAATAIGMFAFIAKLVILSIIILVALDQMGMNITTLIAGLGVGGIAIALAVQHILGDLFASLTIILDKPFVVGDFLIVDDHKGTVENVGLKTTRVRSLSGELLVFPNSSLLQSRIRNFQQMHQRRVVFTFGVLYETPLEKLRSIPPLLKSLVEKQKMTRFDRAHFLKWGDSSIDFEVVYFVLCPDYNAFMDVHQLINFELIECFRRDGINFAYPTQTLYLQGTEQPKSRESPK